MRQLYKSIYILPALFFLNLGGCDGGGAPPSPVILSGVTMGTTYTVKINEPWLEADKQKIQDDVENVLEKINRQMSTYLEESELSKINRARTTGWQEISDDLYAVMNEAIRISNASGGAFDVTIGPVVNLWGFGPDARPDVVPDDGQIKSTLERVGYRQIHLRESPPALRKDREDLYIDLSGIAKGFAVDRLAACIDGYGARNYLVEIGGEIRAKGVNPGGLPWQIGIEKPLTGQRAIQRIVTLENTSMATSGDYRNYFEQDGIRYSHTIDPKSGKPVTHRLASVTVLHPSAMVADAMATALLVMGPEAGLALAQRENLAALLIIRDENAFREEMTERFSHHLHD